MKCPELPGRGPKSAIDRIFNALASVAFGLLVLLGSASAATVEYIHTDALGSPVAVTNATGQVIERTEYEPFGRVLNRTPEDGPGYAGHVSDATTNLSYMQQRYYDSQIGRFLSVDPITTNTTTGANLNRYWYANNNPYKFTDPDGRESTFMLSRMIERDMRAPTLMEQGEALVSVLTGTDAGYADPSGSGAMQSAVTPVEFAVAGGVVRGAGALASSSSTAIADSALVVRGGSAAGANSVEGLARGTATHPSGVTGFSAESANGATLCQLCANVAHNQVGVTSAGEIRAAGGNVVSTQGVSPTHVTVTGLKPEAANRLLTPTRPNPIPPAERLTRP